MFESMSTSSTITTAEQLLAMPRNARRELVRGELIEMAPAGFNHGDIAHLLGMFIGQHVRSRRLGKVYAAETGFVLSRHPDTVRAPDVAFVRKDRVPKHRDRGFFEGAPDLAGEVISPDDTAAEVLDKVNDWLAAGCAMVIVVDPKACTLTTYQPNDRFHVYRKADRFNADPVLPGLEFTVAELFEDLD